MFTILEQLEAIYRANNGLSEPIPEAHTKRRRQEALRLITARPMFAREIAVIMKVSVYSVYQYMNTLMDEDLVTFELVQSIGKNPQRRWKPK